MSNILDTELHTTEGDVDTMPKKRKRTKKAAATNGVAVKSKKVTAKGDAKKRKAAAPKATPRGLPVRPLYDFQIGIRVSAEEREIVLKGCREEKIFSMSNYIRKRLGFAELR